MDGDLCSPSSRSLRGRPSILFSFLSSSQADTLLLAVAEPQSGEQRVRHLPLQEGVAQQAETWARRLRGGKGQFKTTTPKTTDWDESLFFQEALGRLKKQLAHKWEFIVMQAEEQVRLAKDRKKGDKIVTDSQERAYWRAYRPPPGCLNCLESPPYPNVSSSVVGNHAPSSPLTVTAANAPNDPPQQLRQWRTCQELKAEVNSPPKTRAGSISVLSSSLVDNDDAATRGRRSETEKGRDI